MICLIHFIYWLYGVGTERVLFLREISVRRRSCMEEGNEAADV